MKKNILFVTAAVAVMIFSFVLFIVKRKKTSYMESSNEICYTSHTVTGLGDRLFDLCSVMTQAPDSKIKVKWNIGKDQERSVYDTNLIQIENGEIRYELDENSCTKNLDVEFPNKPGANVPDTSKIDTFRNMAKRIKPAPEVENVLPKQPYIAIHIRGTDKIISHGNDRLVASYEQFDEIKKKCVEYVKTHTDKTYFICTDDEKLKNGFIQECGGVENVKLVNIDYVNLDRAIVDLFAMSRAELIIQCTKYSTMSMFASIMGATPLLNFFYKEEGEAYGRDDWNWRPFTYGVVG
jgi:hypothetical protein